MSAKLQISRYCKECQEWTHTVCCFVFGKFWLDKSHDGEGCVNPLDDVAESWRKAGWKPGDGVKAQVKFSQNGKPSISRKPATRQTSLFSSPNPKPAESPPLSDDDY